MIDYCVAVIDDVVEGFIRNFTWQVAFSTYWFLFFVEFPRYYILDMLVVGHRKLFYRRYRKKENVARMKLFIENPFVSIIVPGKNEGANVFKLVTSLREQTYSNFEIIIVDDGSDDNTPMICRDLEKKGLSTDTSVWRREEARQARQTQVSIHRRGNISSILTPIHRLTATRLRRFSLPSTTIHRSRP